MRNCLQPVAYVLCMSLAAVLGSGRWHFLAAVVRERLSPVARRPPRAVLKMWVEAPARGPADMHASARAHRRKVRAGGRMQS